MESFGNWEVIGTLGKGGQSTVYKVRSPKRCDERRKSLRDVDEALAQRTNAELLARSIWGYARPDSPDELGALKRYTIKEAESEEAERFKNEVASLNEKNPGLPRLMDANTDERWIVTELFPAGTLEHNILKFKGDLRQALHAFRHVVAAAAALHEKGHVHRDIKPGNVFLRSDSELVLGDFGIVYMPFSPERVTVTDERVGPRDYMPPWADLGERLERVHPNFDVYMMGKLLWCMVAGRLKLPREYYRRPAFDLTQLFPDDRKMHLANSILDRCVVEEPSSCLPSGQDLLKLVDQTIATIDHAAPFRDRSGALNIPCRICGVGFYKDRGTEIRPNEIDAKNMPGQQIHLHIFVCDVCAHYALFAPGNPEEAAKRNWTPWG